MFTQREGFLAELVTYSFIFIVYSALSSHFSPHPPPPSSARKHQTQVTLGSRACRFPFVRSLVDCSAETQLTNKIFTDLDYFPLLITFAEGLAETEVCVNSFSTSIFFFWKFADKKASPFHISLSLSPQASVCFRCAARFYGLTECRGLLHSIFR
jgi:hypothetical protein